MEGGGLKLIYCPTVRLIGRMELDRMELREWLEPLGDDAANYLDAAGTSDPELASETAGRLCYKSFAKPRPGGPFAYHRHLIESKHGSVYHHAVFAFVIGGVSRSLSHELIRHSVGLSVSQLSQRYVSEPLAFVVPPAYVSAVRLWIETATAPEGNPAIPWCGAMRVASNLYRALIAERSRAAIVAWERGAKIDTREAKRIREAARSVLPNAVETHLYVTANARALRNLFEQRCSLDADAEIRRLCLEWLNMMKDEAPNLFYDFTFKHEGEIEYATCEHHKI